LRNGPETPEIVQKFFPQSGEVARQVERAAAGAADADGPSRWMWMLGDILDQSDAGPRTWTTPPEMRLAANINLPHVSRHCLAEYSSQRTPRRTAPAATYQLCLAEFTRKWPIPGGGRSDVGPSSCVLRNGEILVTWDEFK